VIQEYGSAEQQNALLPSVVMGDRVFAVAVTEPRATLDPDDIHCEARPSGDGYVLRGTKHFVRGAGAADLLVVLARLGDGPGLFLVPKPADGLTAVALENVGDDDLVRFELEHVRVPAGALLGGAAQPWAALDRIATLGALIEAGYGVGIIARDTEMTINYVKDRVQFGRPLGSLQAVQHQVADQVTDVDCGRYLTLYAAWSLDTGRPEAPTDVARAKAWVSDALRRVTRTGNQLHGGIGYTKEYDLHFYFQRAKLVEFMYGQADEHRERIAAALLD
jgi:alkylation response protein AidB-like acyl-CoA dehydrogenase